MTLDFATASIYTLLGFVGFIASIAASYLAFIWYQHRKYDHIPGPKRSSFILGNLTEMKRKIQKGDIWVQVILDWMIQYGVTIRVNLLHEVVVMTADLDSVKDLMVTGGHPKAVGSYRRLQRLYGQRLIGFGLVSETDIETWKKKRAIMNPAFHRGFLKSLMPQFNESADVLINKLSTFADGKTNVGLGQYLHCVTLDVIGKVAFGMDINGVEQDDSPFRRAIFKILEGVSEGIRMTALEHENPLYLPQLKKETREAIKFLRKTGRECLAARKAAIASGDNSTTDILSYVLKANANNPDITEENLVDDFITFFIAGQETTANTVSFVLMQLGKHPHIYKRLKEEVDAIIGSKMDVNYDDIGKLEYMSMVLKETLRLFPIAPITFREIKQDHVVGGYTVPANTTIIMTTYASSRLPQFNPDPLHFDPERFNPKNGNRPNMYAYYPFAIGPRSCIGQTFGQIEAKLLLSKMLQRFDIHLDPTQSYDIQDTLTLRPKSGVLATLTVR